MKKHPRNEWVQSGAWLLKKFAPGSLSLREKRGEVGKKTKIKNKISIDFGSMLIFASGVRQTHHIETDTDDFLSLEAAVIIHRIVQKSMISAKKRVTTGWGGRWRRRRLPRLGAAD